MLGALLACAVQLIDPVTVHLLAKASEGLLSRFDLTNVTHEDPHVRLLVSLWSVETVLKVIDLLYYLRLTSVLEEGHLVYWEFGAAAIVKLGWLEDDIILAELSLAKVNNVLDLEVVFHVIVIEGKAIHLLIQVTLLHSAQDLL